MLGGRGRRGEGYCPWFAFSFSRLGAHSVHSNGYDRGQRLTAGWTLQRWFWVLYGSGSSPEVLLVALQKRPPEGAVGRCPAAHARLDSGLERRMRTDVRKVPQSRP